MGTQVQIYVWAGWECKSLFRVAGVGSRNLSVAGQCCQWCLAGADRFWCTEMPRRVSSDP